MSFPSVALTAWIVAAVVMLVLWCVQLRTRNAGVVDVAWTFGVGATIVTFAVFGDGDSVRRLLVACLGGIWSLRLGVHLWIRVRSEPEDGRYADLRSSRGDRVQSFLFGFFQLQALWVVLFALPAALASENAEAVGWIDGVAVLLWCAALVGEALADRQLAGFRRSAGSSGRVCQVGLWRYSRHPNYFFEWLHWWAYPLLALHAPYGWLGLAAPLVMLFFLLKVTGIPPTEARALRSRGDAYRRYQQTTSAFFPWPPKELELPR